MRPAAAADAAMPTLAARVGVLLAYLVLIALNTASGMGWLGPSQADVSGKWRTSLVPAGWAFSIWGVIFSLQGAAALYAALPAGYQAPSKRAAVNAVAVGWPLTWACETAWLITFPRQTVATFYLSAVLLFAGLAAICWTATRAYGLVAQPRGSDLRPGLLTWCLFVLPTSANAAWMSVASCLGLDVLGLSQGLPARNELQLAATLAAIVAAIGAYVILVRRDVVWGLVLIWAFSAVIGAQPRHPELIVTLAWVAIGVAALCSGYVAVCAYQAGAWGHHGSGPAAAALLGEHEDDDGGQAGSSSRQAA